MIGMSGGIAAAVPENLQNQYGRYYATNVLSPQNKGLLSQMGVSPELIKQAVQTQQIQPNDLATKQKAAWDDLQSYISVGKISVEEGIKAYENLFGKDALDNMRGTQKKYEPKTQKEALEFERIKEQQKADVAGQKIQTKQDLKLKAAKPKEKSILNAVDLTTDTLLKSVEELLKMEGADSIYGLVGAYTPNIREKARNAQAKLNSVISQLGVRALNDMRAASQTGGAVGQVTEKEWPILQSQIASLERAQSWESAKQAMEDIITTVNRVKKYAHERYNDTYGEDDSPSEATNNTPVGAKRAPDGKLYIPDPQRAGKYLLVEE